MKRDQPLVSVIIPTYGRDEKLVEAVRSVIEQTYDNIELFVVDDASPEPVEEHLSSVPLESLTAVRVIRHDENRGANTARNSGIDAANGKYVAFLDDDDRWVETKLSRQVDTFETAGSEIGVVYTGIREEKPERTGIKTPNWRGTYSKSY